MTKKEEKLIAERERIENMKIYERSKAGCVCICGIDEAGRGPFAGPVVAGAVVLPLDDPEREILYLNDSKKLSEKKREDIFREILSKATAVGMGYVGAGIIDKINILQATYLAMHKAIDNLQNTEHLPRGLSIHSLVKEFVLLETEKEGKRVIPDFVLADAVTIPGLNIPQEGIIKGDAKSISIAAGSIVAKVTRDHIMLEYDRKYPEYGFASNKGYGTKAHIEALQKYGPLDIHRRSFIHKYI